MNEWTILKDSAALLLALFTSALGLRTYALNARTRRTEVLAKLHTSFFVAEDYKRMRSLLDDDGDAAEQKREQLAIGNEAEFTDFLNYFEFVAYLWKSDNLNLEDVRALLGYYLDLLWRSPAILKYVEASQNDFEHLRSLFDTLKKERA